MLAPACEDDLKRRARRRLIGAVALTVVAVILLPLLLEDEPPPAGPLAVRLATTPVPPRSEETTGLVDEPIVAIVPSRPVAGTLEQAATPPLAKIKTGKPVVAKPLPNPAPQSVSRPEPKIESKPKPVALPEPAKAEFVVQLAALSDATRAGVLKDRAAAAGLPVHVDKSGALTRVRVGPFPTREAAAAAASKLNKIGVTGQVMAK